MSTCPSHLHDAAGELWWHCKTRTCGYSTPLTPPECPHCAPGAAGSTRAAASILLTPPDPSTSTSFRSQSHTSESTSDSTITDPSEQYLLAPLPHVGARQGTDGEVRLICTDSDTSESME